MREPKNQMLGTMEPPLMQLSVNILKLFSITVKELFEPIIVLRGKNAMGVCSF